MAQVQINPDSTAWEGLDVYLFMNGQDSCPPRKFHLDASDIENWETTLFEISEKQYGEMLLLNLYVSNGTPIKSPLELCHGTAYVSVPACEDFKPAGYDRYLMKAIKSLEKRRSITTTDTLIKSVLAQADKRQEIKNNKNDMASKVIEKQDTPGRQANPQKISCVCPPSPISGPQRNYSSTRKLSAQAVKKPGNGDLKTNPVGLRKNTVRYRPSLLNKSNDKLPGKTINRPLNSAQKRIALPNDSNKKNDSNGVARSRMSSKEENANNMARSGKIIQFTKEEFDSVVDRIVQKVLSQKSQALSKNLIEHSLSGTSLNERPNEHANRENYISLVNKGDVVNLQLNIEVENVDGIIACDKIKLPCDQEVDNTAGYYIRHSNSTGQFILTPFRDCCNKDPKTSACICDNETNNQDKQNVTPCCQTEEEIQKDRSRRESTLSQRYDPSKIKDLKEPPLSGQPSTMSPWRYKLDPVVEKDFKRTQGEETPVGKKLPSAIAEENDSDYVSKDKQVSRQHSKTSLRCLAKCALEKYDDAKNAPSRRPSSANQASASMSDGENVIEPASNETTNVSSNQSTDNNTSTQTEWNNVVLEARPKEGGQYTFHFPTLESIKNYVGSYSLR